jgi:glutathione reductase (NADPH)
MNCEGASAPNERMTDYDFDLFVIGAGSGGVRAARVAANHGAKVAIAEEFRIGGTCVIRGCVPKKLYVYASRFHDEFEDARGFGWSVGEISFDWPTLVAAKEKEISRLSAIYEKNLVNAGVEIYRLRATLKGPNEVRLSDGRRLTARRILVATGGAPVAHPAIPGLEHCVTSNEIFDLPTFPNRLLIVGAGYIAVEFASVFTRLGAQTHLSYRAERPLRGFDENLREHVHVALQQAGVVCRSGVLPRRIEKRATGLQATFQDGSEVEVDAVLLATGRRPSTQGLGLEAAGVKTSSDGAIIVDATSQSSISSIYAVGDVTNRMNLTPVAIREGQAFADTVFGGVPATVDYVSVPTAVFTTPEIGTVGLSEDAAKEQYARVVIFETSFRPMKATLSGRAERVYMKLVVDGLTDRVLGAHIFGADSGEMAQVAAIAIRMGATKRDFDSTMALHPTMAEELVTMRSAARVHQRSE